MLENLGAEVLEGRTDRTELEKKNGDIEKMEVVKPKF